MVGWSDEVLVRLSASLVSEQSTLPSRSLACTGQVSQAQWLHSTVRTPPRAGCTAPYGPHHRQAAQHRTDTTGRNKLLSEDGGRGVGRTLQAHSTPFPPADLQHTAHRSRPLTCSTLHSVHARRLAHVGAAMRQTSLAEPAYQPALHYEVSGASGVGWSWA
eukprot:362881-Chlamydomonas_euryale.AAC.2